MSRALALLAALAIAAPASAANYTGTPTAPGTEKRIVARDIVWSLADGSYQGRTDESRPLVLCQSLAKKSGRLSSFIVDGRAFADAELAKCNASAPDGSQPALAQAK